MGLICMLMHALDKIRFIHSKLVTSCEDNQSVDLIWLGFKCILGSLHVLFQEVSKQHRGNGIHVVV